MAIRPTGNQTMDDAALRGEFDYIVVGGGSSGAVVTGRLIELGYTVCLVEAGPSDVGRQDISDLSNWPQLLHSEYDYDYAVESDGAGNPDVIMSRGRVLGGSGSINGCAAWRAPARDLDAWSDAGATGWDAKSMRTAYDRVLARTGIEYASTSELATDLIAACAHLGIPEREFSADGSAVGAGWVPFSKRGTRRQSGSVLYLHPFLHEPDRLLALTDTQAVRLLFDKDLRASAVETTRGTVRARNEIILSCGAIDTPKLLLLSGIGPKDHLESRGIDVKLDLPVGLHLLDHPEGVVIFELVAGRESQSTYGADMVLLGSLHNSAYPDVMMWLFEGHFDDFSLKTDVGRTAAYASLSPDVLYARSEGRISLRSADPDDPPRIELGHLSHPGDVHTMIEAIRFARKLADTHPFAAWIASEISPGPTVQAEVDLEHYIRSTSYTAYHPAGTCRMGDPGDPRTVVDPNLRVRGTTGLRVVDASIFPSMIGVNPNITCMAIGERAADLLNAPGDG